MMCLFHKEKIKKASFGELVIYTVACPCQSWMSLLEMAPNIWDKSVLVFSFTFGMVYKCKRDSDLNNL